MCFFLCKRCQNKIAKYFDIFAMSKDTVSTNFCNPGGYIHETLTVNKTFDSAVRMVDKPSSEFSWFPGKFKSSYLFYILKIILKLLNRVFLANCNLRKMSYSCRLEIFSDK